MRNSVRQWCSTLLAGYPIGSQHSLGQPAFLGRPTPNMQGPAISRYGVLRGRKLVICRLLKCYPFLDPVK